MSVDAVLSYHLNPATCGVAKFNHALAKRLGVPCSPLATKGYTLPLISIKGREIPLGTSITQGGQRYALFLHDNTRSSLRDLIADAEIVYAANPEIAAGLRTIRPDVITAHCPATVDGNPHRGAYRVLTFGMAHKLVLPHFKKLKEDLDRDHPDYTLSLSTAVHEGSPWDEALTTSVEAMRGIFGEKLRVLGFLADDALARELAECDAVAAFFVPALRANNTSAWAALAAGKFLYTNLDAHSPELDPTRYGWDALLEKLA